MTEPEHSHAGAPVNRRRVLAGTGMLALAGRAAACDRDPAHAGSRRISPSGAQVRQTAARRARRGGPTRSFELTPGSGTVDLGEHTVHTWSYGDQLAGPLLRGDTGERMRVQVHNKLAEPTTVHWHGLAIRNDMDGVPHLTQPPIAPGADHRYEFTLPYPGTYLYHSHFQLQRARGLYGPLIIDDPREPGDYDVEFVVVLDAWTDGLTATPEQVLGALRKNRDCRVPVVAGALNTGPAVPPPTPPAMSSKGPMDGKMMSIPNGLAGDIQPPLHLLNGRMPTAPAVLTGKPGQRARIRLINASASSVYRVALGGHRLTVTATDAYPVQPVTVDTLRISSGERYDVVVTLQDGAFPLAAVAEGRRGQALALVRTGSGTPPPPTVQPAELTGRMLDLSDLTATADVALPNTRPRASHDLWLDGQMAAYVWQINGHAYQAAHPFTGITPTPVRTGDRLRLRLLNQTPMYHPIHIHGHTFQITATGKVGKQGTAISPGARKDTVLVAPMHTVTLDLQADNPGQWLTHCHNAYHLASGMATVLSYVT